MFVEVPRELKCNGEDKDRNAQLFNDAPFLSACYTNNPSAPACLGKATRQSYVIVDLIVFVGKAVLVGAEADNQTPQVTPDQSEVLV